MLDWLRDLEVDWTTGLIGLVLMIALGVAATALAVCLLLRMPADYFQEPPPRPSGWGWLKTVLGPLLIALGIVLSLPGVPGPGTIVVLIGLMLTHFPGKRWLERKLVCRPRVFASLNWIRGKFGKPPLKESCQKAG